MVTLIFFVQWFPTTIFPCVTVACIVFFHCCILMLCLLMSNKRSKCSFHHCWSLSLWVYFWSGIVEEEWNRLMPTSCHSREQGPQEGVKPLWWSVVKIILHDGLHTDYVNQVHIRVTHSKFKTFRCTQSLRMHRQYDPLRRSPPSQKKKTACKPKINQDYLKMWSLFCIGMWEQIQQNSVFLFL